MTAPFLLPIIRTDCIDRVLVNFSKDDAYRILSNSSLAQRTAGIADYWLSLWDADGYPARGSISPSHIKPLLPGVILFRVVPGQSVIVRMAGTSLYQLLKFEITGADWLAVTPRGDRAERLAVFSRVAQGNIALGRWTVPHSSGRVGRCEKLLLPLRPAPDDDAIAVLGFVDWAPRLGDDPDISLQAIPLPESLDRRDAKYGARAPLVQIEKTKNTGRARAADAK